MEYDEFGLLRENAEEAGLPWDGPPAIVRVSYTAGDQELSALRWGAASPQAVFLHGGGQNAHTWDTVLLALGIPALAIDLPGHGHSAWREDRDYGPERNSVAAEQAIRALAPDARSIVGMSLGGLTALCVLGRSPELFERAVIVDVLPSAAQRVATMTKEQKGAVALVSGPRTYPSLDAMIDAAVEASPNRPRSALRRGVLHNARETEDGSWTWRYDRPDDESSGMRDLTALWDYAEHFGGPLMLVRGGNSVFVSDDDVAELRRRVPSVRTEVVADSGHSVQSDQPVALVDLLKSFL